MTNNLIEKWAKNKNRHFVEQKTQMAKRYTNRCSILEVSREMQIKTTKRHYFHPLMGGG